MFYEEEGGKGIFPLGTQVLEIDNSFPRGITTLLMYIFPLNMGQHWYHFSTIDENGTNTD